MTLSLRVVVKGSCRTECSRSEYTSEHCQGLRQLNGKIRHAGDAVFPRRRHSPEQRDELHCLRLPSDFLLHFLGEFSKHQIIRTVTEAAQYILRHRAV